MNTRDSFMLGVRSSTPYFISTFIFGVLFGLAALAHDVTLDLSVMLGAATFSASASFVTLEFWQQPFLFGTIALSVFLVSTRNILLGMAMTHHFDNHSTRRKIFCLFLLNDPGVVTSYNIDPSVDRLSYIMGYGLSLMFAWMGATIFGFLIADFIPHIDLSSLSFAGPLVITTMMMLFIKNASGSKKPWIFAGVMAFITSQLGLADYFILLASVLTGVIVGLVEQRLKRS